MSLRYRLNLMLVVTVLIILVAGSLLVGFNARRSVATEIESSVLLASSLIESGMALEDASEDSFLRWLDKFLAVSESRHLKVTVASLSPINETGDGEALSLSVPDVPDWFIEAVRPETLTIRQTISRPNGTAILLFVEADPRDEIAEAWGEAVDVFGLIAAMAAIIFVVVTVTVERAFKPVSRIITGLDRLENGHFQERIPPFSSPEFSRIANAINHTAGVLEKSRRDNQVLRQHSLEVREEERRFLAHELHDEFGQSLSAVKVVAVSLKNGKLGEQSLPALGSIIETCDHLFFVLRHMMRQLHPLILDELGLKAALDNMVESWPFGQAGIRVNHDADPAIDSISRKHRIHVFRIVQECLTNILKHADATLVDIYIGLTGEGPAGCGQNLELEIRDDGVGFDPRAITAGFGLRGIRERVEGLSGELSIRAVCGDGVTIRVEFPFHRDAA